MPQSNVLPVPPRRAPVEAIEQNRAAPLERAQVAPPRNDSRTRIALITGNARASRATTRRRLVAVQLHVIEPHHARDFEHPSASVSFTNTPTAAMPFGSRRTIRRAFAGVMYRGLPE